MQNRVRTPAECVEAVQPLPAPSGDVKQPNAEALTLTTANQASVSHFRLPLSIGVSPLSLNGVISSLRGIA